MTAPAPTAYSYIRFSSKKQEEGDSIRRQVEDTAAWATRNGVYLDTSLQPDRGISAFRGKNRDIGSLSAFLKLVESGRVLPGSFLVVEALDRLTRQEIQPALLLILNLLQKGVRVVQLRPVEMTYDSNSDTTPIILMLVELSRAHSESKVKSDRVGAAWAQRRKAARARSELMTRKLPAWIRQEGDWLVVIPERAEAIRHIFELSGAGYGLHAIMRRLRDEGVQAFGPSGRWSIAYLDLILKDKRATGEYWPRVRGGKPDGEPIKDYFPRIVSDEVWGLARQGARARHRKPGRTGAVVNVFQGLLKGALDRCSYVVGSPSSKNPHPVLRSAGPRLGVGNTASFPLPTFEEAILSCLREIDPHEILNGDAGPDESLALAGQLAAVEERISEVEAELLEGDVPALARVVRTLEGQRKELNERLAAARQKAAHPLSESWGEAQSLLTALRSAPDPKDARLRLRAALRRVIETIWLVVVKRGRDRVCAVQVWFTGGERHRDYIIVHRPPKANASVRQDGGRWWRSLSPGLVPDAGGLDLRDRRHADDLRAVLEQIDLGLLVEALAAE
jgi:DNA invertase Pin-like site-specific DNA recombinase